MEVRVLSLLFYYFQRNIFIKFIHEVSKGEYGLSFQALWQIECPEKLLYYNVPKMLNPDINQREEGASRKSQKVGEFLVEQK